MDTERFFDLATKFADLGGAVTDQLLQLDNGADADDMNPNALDLIEDFLRYAATQGLEGTDILLDEIARTKI